MIFYYIVVLSMPLLKFGLFEQQTAGVTIEKYLGAVCLLVAAAEMFSGSKTPSFLGTTQSRMFVLLSVIVAASYLNTVSQEGPSANPLALMYLSQFLFFLATLILVNSVDRLRRVLLMMVGSLGLSSLIVIREWQKGAAIFGDAYRSGYVAGDPNYFAASALLCIPLAFYLGSNLRGPVLRGFCWVALLLGICGIMVTSSRGGLIGLAVALTFSAIYSKKRVLNLALLTGIVMLAMVVSPTSPLQRFLHPQRSEDAAVLIRMALWRASLRMIKAHPLLGVGVGQFEAKSLPYIQQEFPWVARGWLAHSTYLEITAELGIPGFLVFVGLMFHTFRSLRQVYRKAREQELNLLRYGSLGLQAGLLGFSVAILLLSAEFLKLFWLVLFLSMCLPRILAQEVKKKENHDKVEQTHLSEIENYRGRTPEPVRL